MINLFGNIFLHYRYNMARKLAKASDICRQTLGTWDRMESARKFVESLNANLLFCKSSCLEIPVLNRFLLLVEIFNQVSKDHQGLAMRNFAPGREVLKVAQ